MVIYSISSLLIRKYHFSVTLSQSISHYIFIIGLLRGRIPHIPSETILRVRNSDPRSAPSTRLHNVKPNCLFRIDAILLLWMSHFPWSVYKRVLGIPMSSAKRRNRSKYHLGNYSQGTIVHQVNVNGVQQFATRLTATETHMPYWITQ